MAGFLAAIPVIGQFLDSVFSGIDKISTTDEERLKFKTEMMTVAGPVITMLVQAQAEFDKAQKDIQIAAIQSGDAFVRRVRPMLMCATFLAWAGIEGFAMYMAGANPGYMNAAADRAFWAFGLIGGLFTATRGIEKGVMHWAQRNGKNGGNSAH